MVVALSHVLGSSAAAGESDRRREVYLLLFVLRGVVTRTGMVGMSGFAKGLWI